MQWLRGQMSEDPGIKSRWPGTEGETIGAGLKKVACAASTKSETSQKNRLLTWATESQISQEGWCLQVRSEDRFSAA